VDTSTPQVVIGDTTNGLVFNASTGPEYKGSARVTRYINLAPEYPGSVLDAANDTAGSTNCSTSNTGTMTSGYEIATSVHYNLYQWVTSQGTAQCYDVVASVVVPSDFAAWTTNPVTIKDYTTNTTTGKIELAIFDTAGGTTPITNFNYANVTPGSASTWTTTNVSGSFTGTYTAGSSITIRVRLTAVSGVTVKLGDLKLTYLSKF